MKRLITRCLFLTACGMMLVAVPLPVLSDPVDPYIQAARKEGSVNIGITLRKREHGKPAGELYIAAFQKRYPFLRVNHKRIGGASDRERIISEMTGGLYNWDVATASDTHVPTIAAANLSHVLDWEKLGVPKFLIHPRNYVINHKTSVSGIAYNRDLVPDEIANTFTWETCTDPQWKGKTASSARPYHLTRLYLEDAWGREKTLDYAKRWSANKPSFEAHRSPAIAKLSSGAYHMVCGMPRDQVKKLEFYSGAKNVGFVFTEPVPLESSGLIYVTGKAQNLNAAILFLAWTGTREAQGLLDDVDFTGHPSIEGSRVNKDLKGKKVADFTWEDSDTIDNHLAEIIQAMGIPVVRGKAKKKK